MVFFFYLMAAFPSSAAVTRAMPTPARINITSPVNKPPTLQLAAPIQRFLSLPKSETVPVAALDLISADVVGENTSMVESPRGTLATLAATLSETAPTQNSFVRAASSLQRFWELAMDRRPPERDAQYQAIVDAGIEFLDRSLDHPKIERPLSRILTSYYPRAAHPDDPRPNFTLALKASLKGGVVIRPSTPKESFAMSNSYTVADTLPNGQTLIVFNLDNPRTKAHLEAHAAVIPVSLLYHLIDTELRLGIHAAFRVSHVYHEMLARLIEEFKRLPQFEGLRFPMPPHRLHRFILGNYEYDDLLNPHDEARFEHFENTAPLRRRPPPQKGAHNQDAGLPDDNIF